METVLSVLRSLLVLFEVVLLFNLIIAVHELGHFLAARWRGLYVEKFAIWFGKPLWSRKVGGVEYVLGSIPAGGYVMLPQMAPVSESLEGRSGVDRAALPPASPLDKIIVAFAGPLFSLLLAFLFALVIWRVGKPVNETETTTVVGYVDAEGPAAKAGLRPGDRIVAVDGKPVDRFQGMTHSVVWNITRSEGSTIPVQVERDGQLLPPFQVTPHYEPSQGWWRRRATRQILVAPAYTPVVQEVQPGSPAAAAGLQPHDQIVSVNGQPCRGIEQFSEVEQQSYRQPIALEVRRPGQPELRRVALPATPLRIKVVPQGPAAAAGLRDNDVVLAVNDEPLARFTDLTAAVHGSNGRPVPVRYVRDGREATVQVTPRVAEATNAWAIGISVSSNADGITKWGPVTHLSYPDPVEQVATSVSGVVNTLGALFSPKSDIKPQQMSGPIGIGKVYYSIFTGEESWRMALWFTVVINVNLALVNLLPIPMLDGGHIVLALLEAIRRKPVNVRVLEAVQGACALFIIGYMLFVTFYDVSDLAPERRNPAMKFVPNPAPPPAAPPGPAPASPAPAAAAPVR